MSLIVSLLNMEIPKEVLKAICLFQHNLKNSIRDHQLLTEKLSKNPSQSSVLKARLLDIETTIKGLGREQRPLIDDIRTSLEEYQQKRRRKNLDIDHDADNEYVANQLREYQLVLDNKVESTVTKRKMKRKKKPKVNIDNGDDDDVEPKETDADCNNEKVTVKENPKSRLSSTDEKSSETSEAATTVTQPKSKMLLDRRSNLLSALNKVYIQNSNNSTPAAVATSPTPTPASSTVSRSSSQSPPPPICEESMDSIAASTDSLKLPDLDPDSQRYFLGYLGIVTHDDLAALLIRRSEKRKRHITTTAKNEYVYGDIDLSPPRQKKKKYLQQTTPPTTRARKNKERDSINFSSGSVQSAKLTADALLKETNTGVPCIVCRLSDPDEDVNRCEYCGEFYHPSCHGPGPLSVQTRFCPYCAISYLNGSSMINGKLEQKRILTEINEQLESDLKVMETMECEKRLQVETQKQDRDELLSDQTNVQEKINNLLDFIATFKKSSDTKAS